MDKRSTSLDNLFSGKKIREYSTYMIPLAFLLVVDALWKKETESEVLFVGTLFFFIYFYLIDSFIKNYTRNNISKMAEYVLLALLFLTVYLPFYFRLGLIPRSSAPDSI